MFSHVAKGVEQMLFENAVGIEGSLGVDDFLIGDLFLLALCATSALGLARFRFLPSAPVVSDNWGISPVASNSVLTLATVLWSSLVSLPSCRSLFSGLSFIKSATIFFRASG